MSVTECDLVPSVPNVKTFPIRPTFTHFHQRLRFPIRCDSSISAEGAHPPAHNSKAAQAISFPLEAANDVCQTIVSFYPFPFRD